MARQEMLMARCDRKECKTVVEIERNTVAPEGWLQISVEIDGVWDSKSKLEFCSEKCVSLWARDRNKVVTGNGNNGHPSVPTNYRDEVITAIEIFMANGGSEFNKTNIAEIAELDPTTVGGWLKKLEEEGLVKYSHGVGKRGDPFVYVKL